MIKFETTLCVDTPRAEAWQALSRIDDIALWVDSLKASHCSTAINRGLGAVRVCVLQNDFEFSEKFIHWDEGKAFTYRVIGKGMPGILHAENRWSLEEKGQQTLIRSQATLMIRGGLLGRLLEPLVLFMLKRQVPHNSAALKYFVEQGKPFIGDSKSLPRAAIFC